MMKHALEQLESKLIIAEANMALLKECGELLEFWQRWWEGYFQTLPNDILERTGIAIEAVKGANDDSSMV
jgi:hypothetical protein